MNRVYVIIVHIEHESTDIQDPLYLTLDKAIEEVHNVIASIEENQASFANKFREIKNNTWRGGYGDESTIYIKEMEVV